MSQAEQLQAAFESLEHGTPLDQVLAELPTDQQDLAPLLSLAIQTRAAAQDTVIHPLKAQAQQQRVTAAVRQRLTAAADQVTSPTGRSRSPSGRITLSGLPRSFWAALSTGAVILTLFALIMMGSLAFLLSTVVSARAATLMDVSGVVEAAPAGDDTHWVPVADGEKLRAGMHLRTRASSNATLLFYDGSRTTIAPHSELVLSEIGGGWTIFSGRGLQVRYQQFSGQTTHSVVPLKGGASFFEVLTPAGKASVHGTRFDVNVSADGSASFAVNRGVVEIIQSGASVTLTAGQATYSTPGDEPQPPGYQFFVQGTVGSIAGDIWVVNGLSFHVDPALAASTPLRVGDEVAVHGRILTDGTFQADSIGPAHNDREKLRFTGLVDAMGSESWIISGRSIQVNPDTEIETGIQVGDPVAVSFTILPDGAWVAREIEMLDEEETEEEPTPTSEITETLDPDLTPSPTAYPGPETATPEVTATPSLEGTRAGCESTDKQHPEGLTLSARWGVPYLEIMAWFCQGFGFGEIDLAYELAQESGKPVAEIFAMKTGGLGWGQIKQALSPKPTQEPNPTKELKPTKAPKPTKLPKN